jgi:hypothetical protein
VPQIRPADEFEDESDEFAPVEAPRNLRRRLFTSGLGAKAGAMMAVAMFALGFVAMKGHVGKGPAAASMDVALAANPSPALAPASPPPPAPVAVAVAVDTTSAPPPSKHPDTKATTRIDTSATGSIGPDAKHKHKHKHKLDTPKAADPVQPD